MEKPGLATSDPFDLLFCPVGIGNLQLSNQCQFVAIIIPLHLPPDVAPVPAITNQGSDGIVSLHATE